MRDRTLTASLPSLPGDINILTTSKQVVQHLFKSPPAHSLPRGLASPEQPLFLEMDMGGKTIIRPWREHLKLSQKKVAGRMGITQAAYSQMEKAPDKHRRDTLESSLKPLGFRMIIFLSCDLFQKGF